MGNSNRSSSLEDILNLQKQKAARLKLIDFAYVCKLKIPSNVDQRLPLAHIIYTSQFRIPKFVVQISEFGLQDSDFRIRNCEVVYIY